ncbi:hypothetical protein AOCH_002070 [Aspergillus ochraceoroseus]|uniref:Uncharacterized protein n=1 Tax=Aspergillus ochraceoroseus TaxID=138278 RepID=A0A0F8UW20_9EURO|nr:hypothetical protein AOCH_002070 [Aspergillus ochraceoroseus]
MHHNHQHRHHHGIHLDQRSPPPDPEIRRPPFHLLVPENPTFVKRDPSPTDDSTAVTQSCAAGDTSNRCEKPASGSSTTTLPVVLGAVIPIVFAVVVLLFLHRRNLKKLRNEDADDKHKSLDFGMDMPTGAGKSMQEAGSGYPNNHMKGVSLDIGHSPYMLPPSMHGSRDSLNSLSRTIMADDDKYRHVNHYLGADNQSIRSHQRGFPDDAISIAGSTRRGGLGDDMNQGLLGSAQRMSRSSPPLYKPPSEHGGHSPTNLAQVHDTGFELNLPRSPSPVFVPGVTVTHEPPSPIKSPSEANNALRGLAASSPPPEHRPGFPLRDPMSTHVESTPAPMHDAVMPPPRISFPSSDAASDYGDNTTSKTAVPAVSVQHAESAIPNHEKPQEQPMPKLPEEPPQAQNLRLDPRRDTRRLTMTMGLRPLPPEDPADNPEQRANRIRSFYKEYFDESKAGARETYYEDYPVDYYADEEHAFDPVTGGYFDAVPAPYAEPVNRRAMTPLHAHLLDSKEPLAMWPQAHILPTPHMLKDDSLMMAIDYAPGKTFKDQREGRPETPLGGVRPFSPGLRAHTPLASAFDELSVIPSAHALRKSGTFDNLDFAPPPRFKMADTASDAGSIRSNRTGISAAHLYNIRTGAYRVSRLPAGTVGTKDDLMSNLKPSWDMRQ